MRVCLAGAENPSALESLVKVGVKNILCSYFYFRKMGEDRLVSTLEEIKKAGVFVMLDSGAHTFFSFHGESLFHEKRDHIASQASGQEKKKSDYVPPEEYVVEYMEWLEKYGGYFDVYVELDINAIVGPQQVFDWRSQMVSRGLKPMPVYHTSYELQELEEKGVAPTPKGRLDIRMRIWEEWCQKFEYLGVQGGLNRTEYVDLLKISDKYQRKVHGFAMTNKDVFRHLTFYSVDSTSWLSGAKFGVTYICTGDDLKTVSSDGKAVRGKHKEFCEKHKIDFDLLMKDKAQQVNEFNAAQWAAYQDTIDMTHRNDPAVLAAGEAVEIKAFPMPEPREMDPNARFGYWCDACYIAAKCPYYKAKSTCSVVKYTEIKDAEGMKGLLFRLLGQAYERLTFAMGSEKARGGMLDPEVSKELRNFVGLVGQIKEVTDDRDTVKIEAKGNGMLSQLFGSILGTNKSAAPEPEVKDVTPVRNGSQDSPALEAGSASGNAFGLDGAGGSRREPAYAEAGGEMAE